MNTPESKEIVLIDNQTTLNALSYIQLKTETLEKAKALLKFRVNGIDDKEGYKKADASRAKVRQLRLNVQKKAKSVKDQVNDFKRRIDDEANSITGILGQAEDHLKSELAKVDEEKERIKQAEAKRRQQLLLDAGFKHNGHFFVAGEVILAPDKLMSYSEEDLEHHIEAGKREVARIEAEQAEIKRLKEQAEQAERQRILADKKKEPAPQQEEPEEIITAAQPVRGSGIPRFENPPPPPPRSNNLPPYQGGPLHNPGPVNARRTAVETVHSGDQNAFDNGFKTACNAVVQLLSGQEKFTRAQLIERIKSLNSEHYSPF